MNEKNDELRALFIPTLIAILVAAEEKKGSALTKDEVLSIRDNSSTIMVPKSTIEAMNDKRGYADIDPEDCWNEWQLYRKTSTSSKSDHSHDALTIENDSDDTEMRDAEKKARSTLDKFRDYIKKHPKTPAMIKYRVEDKNSASRMWLFIEKDLGNSFEAELFEVPSDFVTYKAGDSFKVEDKDILDWMINDDGDIYGAYTIRVLRDKMSKEERERSDSYMGARRYIDLK